MSDVMAQWVTAALKHAEMTQVELARRLTDRLHRSFDKAAVNKMAKIKLAPGQKRRLVKADEMYAISEITGFPPPDDKAPPATIMPVLSMVSAGRLWGRDAVYGRDILRRISVTDLPVGDWIALEVDGDSMDRVAPNGSIVCVNRSDAAPIAEKFYVFATASGEGTFKRYRPDPDRLVPFSTNPDHEPIFPEGELQVVGRVWRVITDLR